MARMRRESSVWARFSIEFDIHKPVGSQDFEIVLQKSNLAGDPALGFACTTYIVGAPFFTHIADGVEWKRFAA